MKYLVKSMKQLPNNLRNLKLDLSSNKLGGINKKVD